MGFQVTYYIFISHDQDLQSTPFILTFSLKSWVWNFQTMQLGYNLLCLHYTFMFYTLDITLLMDNYMFSILPTVVYKVYLNLIASLGNKYML